jgi:hypothetical protein
MATSENAARASKNRIDVRPNRRESRTGLGGIGSIFAE